MENKVCSNCKQEKPTTDFYSQKLHKHGVMSMCKDCFNHFCTQRWINRKVKYINLLGGKCERCGLTLNNSHYSVFEFHHVDPSTKEYVWTKLRLFSDDRIKNELDECQLLCANCHRIVHSEME